ncbi:hypothetical protein NRA39_00620 [Acinetobacter baumannii]|nr:hypothetical protein [Acinetobacter baumannii]
MKPEQFIKRYGVDEARQVIAKSPEGTTHIHSVTWQYYKQGGNNNYVWGRSDQAGWYLSIYDTLNGMMILEDLKRLVDSLETIESWGGIENCKAMVRRATSNQEPPEKSFARKLQMDVANHESIYGGRNE